MQAYALVADPRYREAALLNLNSQLGANPLGMSFVTGIGARYPWDPLHMPSLYDGIDAPVPGLPVFGPMAVLSNANPFQAAVQADANSYPYAYGEQDPYPILRRYVDTNELPPYSEFTVQEMAWTAGVLGLFACTLSADVTADGRVDPEDLQGVVARWRLSVANPDPDSDPATVNYKPRFDLDGDGVITVRDVMWVTAQLGQTCP
ncbi:MAG: glycoside hydrolase family 9 protein [Anaerolineae bacterium]